MNINSKVKSGSLINTGCEIKFYVGFVKEKNQNNKFVLIKNTIYSPLDKSIELIKNNQFNFSTIEIVRGQYYSEILSEFEIPDGIQQKMFYDHQSMYQSGFLKNIQHLKALLLIKQG